MERKVEDMNVLERFTEDFVRIAEKHCKYIIVSGFVAIASGRTRGTEDIDMIIEKISFERFVELHNSLVVGGFECMQSSKTDEIFNYLTKGDSIRYVRQGNLMPPEMEVKFAKDELDDLQLATRKKLPFTGLDVWFSSIEMNIAFKEELLKSDKDMEDARHLRLIYGDEINETLINDLKKMIRRLRLKKDKYER